MSINKKDLRIFIAISFSIFIILPAYGEYCPPNGPTACLIYCPDPCVTDTTCYYGANTGSCFTITTPPDICEYSIKGQCGYFYKCIIPTSCSNNCTVAVGTCSKTGCSETISGYQYCTQGYVCSNGACVSGSCGTLACPSDSCVGTCGTGLNSCVWRHYPASCDMYCDGNGNCASCTCTYSDLDADSDSTYCSGCGKVWFSSVTAGQNAPCCGDDGTSDTSNDIFENRGPGNSACVEAQVINHNNVSPSKRFLVYNGEIFYCKAAGDIGSGYSFVQDINPGSSIGSWKCRQNGIWEGGTVIGIRGGRIKIVV